MKYLRTHGDFNSIGQVFDTLKQKSPGLHPESDVFGRIVPAPTQTTTNLNHTRTRHREANTINNTDNHRGFTVLRKSNN